LPMDKSEMDDLMRDSQGQIIGLPNMAAKEK